MPFVDPAALVAAFDNARTNDAEHDAALALRDYVAGLADGAGGIEPFPYGEGLDDFDVPTYTRPRDVLTGRATLRMPSVINAAYSEETRLSAWLWAVASVVVVAAVLYLLALRR